MARILEGYEEHNDQDRDERRRSRSEDAPSQPAFKRSARPKRQGNATASFNGLHRRRKKRIQW